MQGCTVRCSLNPENAVHLRVVSDDAQRVTGLAVPVAHHDGDEHIASEQGLDALLDDGDDALVHVHLIHHFRSTFGHRDTP